MADLRDFTKKNPIFVGTDGLRLPSGNSAQRVASANVNGTMRFNTDIAGMEMYTPTGWIPFASPPSISTVTPSTYTGESGTQFILNGAGFTSDAQVYFITSNGTTMLATTVSFIGSAELRATTPRAIRVQEEPISVRVNQQSGIATKVDCIDAGGVPNWITTAGTLGSIFGANTVNVYVSATDPEGTSVTYQITSGSLPGGLNFTTANGLIQGLASSVLANTTYNFTIKANDTVSNNTDRSFSYTVLNRAPVINTAAGSLGTIYSGNAASASISAYDPDGGQLTYSVSSGTLPVNSSLGSANGVITGTPVVVTTNTTYSFTITSTDEGSLTASNNYTYTVLNRPPVWNTASSLSTITDDDIPSYVANTTVNAYDPDGGSVTYTLASGSLPTGMTLVSANGALAGPVTPVGSNTTSTFTVTVTDVGSLTNTRTFTLTVTSPPADANFANTSLLLHGDGTNNANNNLFVDNSSNVLTVTRNGNPTQGTFSPFSADAGKWSTFFTKSNTTYLELPNGSVNVGSNDFSIECWLYPLDRNGASTMFGGNTNRATAGGSSITFTLTNSNGYIECTAWIGGGAINLYSPAIPLNTWTHAIFCRTGSSMSLFVNGTRVATSTSAGGSAVNDGAATYNPAIGANGTGTADNFNGYISNFRMIIGAGVYDATASTITMPTSPLTAVTNTRVLACQDNRIIDRSTNNYAITPSGNPSVQPFSPFTPNAAYSVANTGGSVYFDGNGDYLSLASSTAFSWGSGDFSMEAWVYPTAGGLIRMFDSDTATGFLTFLNTNNTFGFYGGNGTFYETANQTLKQYAWNHCVVASVGGALRLFVNGILVVYAASGGTSTSSARTCGVGSIGTQPWNGYMANVRLVKGGIPSLYSTASTTVGAVIFTPPSIPFTGSESLTGGTVSLLLNNTNAGIIDSTAKTVMETTGDTKISTAQSKFGGSAIYFDGTGDSLLFPNPVIHGFGTGDFTVELWVYPVAWDSNMVVVMGNGSTGFGIQKYGGGSTGNIGVIINGAWAITDATLPTTGQWTHIAVTRTSGTLRFFVNGSVSGSTPSNTSDITGGISGIGGYSGQTYYNGYMDELRITKGVARYTTTFTPATKAFSNK